MRVPPYYVFGQNQLQFYYDLRPVKLGECQDVLPNNIQELIDPDSTIDLSKTERFTSLPNLAFFANSGFPFTRMADLSDTAIVMPDQYTAKDIEAYLDLMGMMGDSTGFPAVRATVMNANGVDQAGDKDLMVLGSISHQPLISRWAAEQQVARRRRASAGRDDLGARSRLHDARSQHPIGTRPRRSSARLAGDNLAAMIGLESPLHSGRTAIIITGSSSG